MLSARAIAVGIATALIAAKNARQIVASFMLCTGRATVDKAKHCAKSPGPDIMSLMNTITDQVYKAHRVLGLVPYASISDLESAYRRLARKTHPDIGGSVVKFRAVRDAYEYLTRLDTRTLYELELRSEVALNRQLTSTHLVPRVPSTEPGVRRFLRQRRWWLLALSVFCWLVVPHVYLLTGWYRYPVPELCNFLQPGEWVFFLGWLVLKK